jgi:hypothetical protein
MQKLQNDFQCELLEYCRTVQKLTDIHIKFKSEGKDEIDRVIKGFNDLKYLKGDGYLRQTIKDGNDAILAYRLSKATDKEVILDILDGLRTENKPIDPRGSYWKSLDLDDQDKYRNILLRGELVSFANDEDRWKFNLTAKGVCARNKDFNKDGEYIEKGERYLRVIKNLAIIPILYALLKGVELIIDLVSRFPCCS